MASAIPGIPRPAVSTSRPGHLYRHGGLAEWFFSRIKINFPAMAAKRTASASASGGKASHSPRAYPKLQISRSARPAHLAFSTV